MLGTQWRPAARWRCIWVLHMGAFSRAKGVGCEHMPGSLCWLHSVGGQRGQGASAGYTLWGAKGGREPLLATHCGGLKGWGRGHERSVLRARPLCTLTSLLLGQELGLRACEGLLLF